MSEILVLVDHVDGTVRKTTNELLTIAKRLGEPSAVYIGSRRRRRADALKKFGAEKIYVVDDAEIKGYLVAPKAEVLQQLVEKTSAGAVLISSSYEGKEIAGRLAIKIELRPDHRRRGRAVRRRRPGHHPVGVRRQLHRPGQGHPGHPDHHGEAERRHPGGVRGRRRGRGVRRDHLRRRQAGADRGLAAAQGDRSSRAHRGRDRGLRWPWHRWRLRARREPRRRPGRGRGCLACRGRLRLEAAQLPGRPDRQDGLAAALRRQRHLRRDPAPGRHADLEDHRRGQQGRRGPDLRARRLRRGRRPAHRPARS